MILVLAAAAALATATPSPTPSADPCASIVAIVTRPTVTNSVCTPRYGHALLETGYTNTSTTGGGGESVAYPQALARIAIGKNLEFYFTPPSYVRASAGGVVDSGWTDTNVGVKWADERGGAFLWGAQAQYSSPNGSPGFTNGITEITGDVNWSYTLSPVWSVGGTVGYVTGLAAIVPSLVVTRALSPASQAYVEYAYFSRAGFALPGKSLIDGGYSLDLTPYLQADIEYGNQLTRIQGQRTQYVGAGLSFMR
jgi:hypothetical protein